MTRTTGGFTSAEPVALELGRKHGDVVMLIQAILVEQLNDGIELHSSFFALI